MAVAVSVLEAGAGRQGKANLMRFRRGWYGCLSRRADALFELTDALLAAGPVISLPYLSLDGLHRRGHGSTYAALTNGRVGAEAARALLADSLPGASCPVFAVDVSVWVRSDADSRTRFSRPRGDVRRTSGLLIDTRLNRCAGQRRRGRLRDRCVTTSWRRGPCLRFGPEWTSARNTTTA
jgi:hypothetical protein